MKAVTFYSYKGGVGRTLALSNLAKKLADYEANVFVLDFDLEAPGLTYKLADQVKGTDALQKKGVVEYISYFQRHRRLPDNFEEYYTELNAGNRPGKIYLMTAGRFQTPEYWEQLMGIDWMKLFEPGGDGVPLVLDLKGRIEKVVKPDVLLIDSRTGVTPAASITLKFMADQCVVMAVNNSENLDGVKMVLDALTTMPENIRPEISFVLTRIPYHDHNELVKDREHTLLEKVKQNDLKGIAKDQISYFGVIHHEPEMGWGETERMGLPVENKDFLWHDYYNLFLKLFPRWAGSAFQKEQEIARLIEAAVNTKQLEYLKKAIELKPRKENQFDNIVRLLIELEEYKIAIEVCDDWISWSTDDYKPYFYKAYALPNLKPIDFELIISLYQKAIKFKPDIAEAYNNWGNALGNLGKYEDAMLQYHKAIEINPDFVLTYNNLGIALDKLEWFAEAIVQYQKAIEIEPNFAEAYNNWGLTLYHLERYREAIEQYQKAIAIKPDFAEAHVNWGIALGSLEQNQQAIAKFQKAIEINPHFTTAYINWGIALDKSEQFQHAIAKFQIAIEIEPDYAEAYQNWGNALGNMAKYEDAMLQYQKATEINPDYADAYHNWGFILVRLEQYEQAIEKFQKAIELKPDYADAFNNWAFSLIHLFHQNHDNSYLKEAKEKGLRSKALGGKVYNLACVYALLEEADLAKDNLKLSLERREISPDIIKSNDSWKSLLGTPAFEELLRAYEA